MEQINILEFSEWEKVSSEHKHYRVLKSILEDSKIRKEIIETEDDKYRGKYLGLQIENPGTEYEEYSFTRFVGINRLGNFVIKVSPKREVNLDYIKMFIEVIADKKVIETNEAKEELYRIYSDKEPVLLKREEINDFIIFLVLDYLTILEKIIKKGLFKWYLTIIQNLAGKVKGKILTAYNLKLNLPYGKKHYNYLKFQIFSANVLPNIILKVAYRKAVQYLERFFNILSKTEIERKIRFIEAGLVQVKERKIYPYEFRIIDIPRIYREYKKAIEIAWQILHLLGFDPSEKIELEKESVKVYPYWINMDKLFELYVYKKLREKYGEAVKYQKEFRTAVGALIPDFIIDKKVLDAKYKYYGIGSKKEELKEDLQQIALYGRLENISPEEPELYIIYPAVENANEINSDTEIEKVRCEYRSFRKMYYIPLKVPIKISNKKNVN